MPQAWTALAGRDAYLAENGFDVAGYDAAYGEYPLLGMRIPIPNSKARSRAIRFHDLHHVATGYGTDNVGEGEISAWELRRGLRPLGLYVGAIVLGGTLLGLLVAPRRTLRAYRASGSGTSLFHGEIPYETLLTLSIAELRAALGVPDEGLASEPRRVHALPRQLA
ncbi:MAG TPA: hypothetical protein VK509_25090 [Polyangiales bacterium]|nr:hypothetical protein [Polyangiales bacterium]